MEYVEKKVKRILCHIMFIYMNFNSLITLFYFPLSILLLEKLSCCQVQHQRSSWQSRDLKPIACCIFVFLVVINTPCLNLELPGTVCIKVKSLIPAGLHWCSHRSLGYLSPGRIYLGSKRNFFVTTSHVVYNIRCLAHAFVQSYGSNLLGFYGNISHVYQVIKPLNWKWKLDLLFKHVSDIFPKVGNKHITVTECVITLSNGLMDSHKIKHSPQITFPPCVTRPSSLTLTSMTVPFVMTPREV